MFLSPFREEEKILQDRCIRGGFTRTVGPTVSFVVHGVSFKWTRLTIIEVNALHNICLREKAKMAVCEFFHHSEQRRLIHTSSGCHEEPSSSCRRFGAFLERALLYLLQAKLVYRMLWLHQVELGDPLR